MLANVKQATIAPLVKSTVTPGTLIFTDEYKIYRLITWGYQHKSVCHAQGEYAQMRMATGFTKRMSHTMEGFGPYFLATPIEEFSSKLPLYLGFPSSCIMLGSEVKLCFQPP